MLKLSSCQEEALEVLNSSANVFLTGQAGTGKSTVLKRWLASKKLSDYAVTASTGIAALLVGGRTVHSFFRIGTGDKPLKELLEGRSPSTRRALQGIKILVIDEVSMISADLLGKLERVAAHDRHQQDLPWGGLQVVVVGDMAQLPPVNGEWSFTSPAWKASRFVPVVLQTQLRTSDIEFASILRRIGRGELDEEVCAFLDSRVVTQGLPYNWVRLMGKRSQADVWNHDRLMEITRSPVYLKADRYCAPGMEWMLEKIAESMPIPQSIAIAEGAFVMFRWNIPEIGVANGTTGYVEEINLDRGEIQVRLADLSGNPGPAVVTCAKAQFAFPEPDRRPPRAAIHQFPLQLAWAITIHKSQGATLDRAVVNLGDLWDPGQAYVALSRVRTKEGLAITGWSPESFVFDSSVSALYDVMERIHAKRVAAKRAAGPRSDPGEETTIQDRALHVVGETLAKAGIGVADLHITARVPAMDGFDGLPPDDRELEPVRGEGVADPAS